MEMRNRGRRRKCPIQNNSSGANYGWLAIPAASPSFQDIGGGRRADKPTYTRDTSPIIQEEPPPVKPPPPPLTPPPPPTPRTPPRPGKLPQFLFLLLLRPKAAYRETGSKKYPLRETQGKVARTRHLSSLFRPSSPRPSPSHRLICPGDQVKGKGEEEEEEEEVSLLISYLYVDAKPVLKHAGKQASYSPLSSLVPPAVVHINHCPPPPLSSLIPRAEPGLCEGGGRRRQEMPAPSPLPHEGCSTYLPRAFFDLKPPQAFHFPPTHKK